MRTDKGRQDRRDWLIVLASLADDVIVLAGIALLLLFLGIEITLPLIAIIAVLFAGFVLLVHKAIVPTLRRRKISGAEGMVGREGRVVETLAPRGMVRIGGELWKARTGGERIGAGEKVEITGISGLTLEVRRKTG